MVRMKSVCDEQKLSKSIILEATIDTCCDDLHPHNMCIANRSATDEVKYVSSSKTKLLEVGTDDGSAQKEDDTRKLCISHQFKRVDRKATEEAQRQGSD